MECSFRCTVLVLCIGGVWSSVIACLLLSIHEADRVIADVESEGNGLIKQCGEDCSQRYAVSATHTLKASAESIAQQGRNLWKTAEEVHDTALHSSPPVQDLTSLRSAILSARGGDGAAAAPFITLGRIATPSSQVESLHPGTAPPALTPASEFLAANSPYWAPSSGSSSSSSSAAFEPIFLPPGLQSNPASALVTGGGGGGGGGSFMSFTSVDHRGLLDSPVSVALQRGYLWGVHDRVFVVSSAAAGGECDGVGGGGDGGEAGIIVAARGKTSTAEPPSSMECALNSTDPAISRVMLGLLAASDAASARGNASSPPPSLPDDAGLLPHLYHSVSNGTGVFTLWRGRLLVHISPIPPPTPGGGQPAAALWVVHSVELPHSTWHSPAPSIQTDTTGYVVPLVGYVVACTVFLGGVCILLLIMLALRPLDSLMCQFERAASLSDYDTAEDVLHLHGVHLGGGKTRPGDAYRAGGGGGGVGGAAAGSDDDSPLTRTLNFKSGGPRQGLGVFITNNMSELVGMKRSIYSLLMVLKHYKEYMPQAVIDQGSVISYDDISAGEAFEYDTDDEPAMEAFDAASGDGSCDDALVKEASGSTGGGAPPSGGGGVGIGGVMATSTSSATASEPLTPSSSGGGGSVCVSARPISPNHPHASLNRESNALDSQPTADSIGTGELDVQFGTHQTRVLKDKSPKHGPGVPPPHAVGGSGHTPPMSAPPPSVLKKAKPTSSAVSLHRKKGVTQVSLGFRDFDDFTRRVPDPVQQCELHSLWLQAVVSDAKDYSGVIERFVADNVDVNFGGLQTCTRGSVKATHYALRVRERVSAIPALFEAYDTEPCIGISSGIALVGNLGCTFIKTPCVLGRTVFNSKAMQAISREVGLDIMMDHRHTDELRGSFRCIPVDIVRLTDTGRKQAVYFLQGIATAAAVEWLYSIEGRESTYERTWKQLKSVGERGAPTLLQVIEQLGAVGDEPIAKNVVARLRQYSDEILTMTGKPPGEYCRVYRNRPSTLPQPEFLRRIPTHRVRSQLHGSAAAMRSSSAGQSQGTPGTSGGLEHRSMHSSRQSHHSHTSQQGGAGSGERASHNGQQPLATEGSTGTLGTLHSSIATMKSAPMSSPAALSQNFGQRPSPTAEKSGAVSASASPAISAAAPSTPGDTPPTPAAVLPRKGSMAPSSSKMSGAGGAPPVQRVTSDEHSTPDQQAPLDTHSFDIAASIEDLNSPSVP